MNETRSLSDLLTDLKQQGTGENMAVSDLLYAFHERGFGFFLFIIALPAALPVPAIGLNTIIALPLLLLTAQQAVGRHTVWVPAKWKQKTIKKSKVDDFVDKAIPTIQKMEIFIKPRFGFITQGAFSHLIGIMGFIMSLAVAVPLPLTNTVPSIGIAAMAIGVLMRDGVAVIIGAIIGLSWVFMLIFMTVYFGTEAIDMIKGFFKSAL